MLGIMGIGEALIPLLGVRRKLLSLLIFLFFSSRAFLVLPSTLAADGGPWAGLKAGKGREIESCL